jgi:hypothetical protein
MVSLKLWYLPTGPHGITIHKTNISIAYEESHFHTHCCETLKSHQYYLWFRFFFSTVYGIGLAVVWTYLNRKTSVEREYKRQLTLFSLHSAKKEIKSCRNDCSPTHCICSAKAFWYSQTRIFCWMVKARVSQKQRLPHEYNKCICVRSSPRMYSVTVLDNSTMKHATIHLTIYAAVYQWLRFFFFLKLFLHFRVDICPWFFLLSSSFPIILLVFYAHPLI